MTNPLSLKGGQGRKIHLDFEGGNVTSDGGLLLLRAVEQRTGLLSAAAKLLADPRNPDFAQHSVYSMLCQRVLGLCAGYEDLNDHHTLRHDLAFQTAADRDVPLASASTLCRMENWASRQTALKLHELVVDKFIASFEIPPRELILDFDATDDRVHGSQAGSFFNGFYDHHIFLPLHVYCGDRLLVSYLRPGNADAALHAGAILKLLVRRLRAAWPEVSLIFRADSGFCRNWLLRWCTRNDVFYIVGLAKNPVLNRMSEFLALKANYGFEESGKKARFIDTFFYRAGTWKVKRKVIARVEFGEKGVDQRYIVTNIKGNGAWLYEDLYCGRGDAENQIKETKNTLFSDRTSCVKWETNQFRVILSMLAHTLLEVLRREGLEQPHREIALQERIAEGETEETTSLPARWSFDSIRLRLLKIGAVIIRNTRRVIFHLASGNPWQTRFHETLCRLTT